MRLMEELQQMDALERELKDTRALEDLQKIDPQRVEQLLGPEARQDLERLQEITRKLEEAGYLEREGDEMKLTARAIRRIADRALGDIFQRLKRDRFGGHSIARRGAGGDQTDESKAYEFGDPFLLDLKETVMNAVERQGPGTPVRLGPDDFAVLRTELRTQAATAVLLDMSRSMLNSGYFVPAKKMALALSALIRGQFPRDALYVIGFSPAPHALVERVERGHQHARRVRAVTAAAGSPRWRQQADPHGHRRRAHRSSRGRGGGLLLPADPSHR
jgi:uncharacterized protein with von Willebrand factor type A (vWA) domain